MERTTHKATTQSLRNGSLYIETLDNNGKVVAITRFALLHLGTDGRDVIEIRTETKQGKSEQRVEVANVREQRV